MRRLHDVNQRVDDLQHRRRNRGHPNGVVVLAAHKTIRNNDNAFEVGLTGLCRADDIGPDNTVLSKHIFDLDISKDDRGHVRDGYSRGWFTRLLARVKPF
ncbi:MAG: flagellar basal body L-ring protein FlgH [Pirellulales bacterium]